MKASWLKLVFAVGFISLLLCCGGRGDSPVIPRGVGGADQPREITLSEALAELDALSTPAGVDESLFSELKSAFASQLGTRNAEGRTGKLVSTPPGGESNRVTDMSIIDHGDGTCTLTWSYRNTGDYNQDGIVNIQDITPLAVHFNEAADAENEWIDGNGDGAINIQDITPLAANFFNECAGYTIESSDNPDSGFTVEATVPRSEASGSGRLHFEHALSLAGGLWIRVVPMDSGGAPGIPGSPQKLDEFTFDVTWTDETTLVDEDQLDLLLDADTENHIYTFDAQGVDAAGLDLSVDRVLVIHGIALERIVDAYQEGDNLIVEGENAPLTDAISDGTIAWDYGVSYTADKIPAMIIDGKRVTADESGVIDFEFPWDDYTYTIHVELNDTSASFKFTVKKDLGPGLGAELVMEGSIQRFRIKDLIELEGRQLQQFDQTMEKVVGEGTVSLVAAATGRDPISLVDLPAPLLEVPFLVGPVPVVLTIEARFVVDVLVPADGSSRISVTFNYDSDLGFSCDGVNVENTGSLGSYNYEEGVTETGASSAVGISFGVAFPRVELSIFWGRVVPYAHIQNVIWGTWDPAAPCQTADYEMRGVAGLNLDLFLISATPSVEFFKQTEKLLRAGD